MLLCLCSSFHFTPANLGKPCSQPWQTLNTIWYHMCGQWLWHLDFDLAALLCMGDKPSCCVLTWNKRTSGAISMMSWKSREGAGVETFEIIAIPDFNLLCKILILKKVYFITSSHTAFGELGCPEFTRTVREWSGLEFVLIITHLMSDDAARTSNGRPGTYFQYISTSFILF